jgi:sugar phosphate isomerase/epimerase
MLHALRQEAAKDLPGTLKRVAALGRYTEIELVSFKGYSGPSARDGFAALAPLPTADIRAMLADAGFRARSCHFKYPELAPDTIEQSIDWALGVGTEYMTVGDVAPTTTADEWKGHFLRLNQCGERLARAGLKLGLHTQNDIWKPFAGDRLVMDALLEAVDVGHCNIELDFSTTQSMKIDPVVYLGRYPGRFFALHLRDAKTPEGQGYLPSVPLGQGDIDWRATFKAARAARVPHYIVEMQTQGRMDPIDAMKLSADFIRGLTID